MDATKRWSLGLLMLSTVIVLWVLSSFLINLIFEDGSYRKPFFITYLNTAAFVFYLLPTAKSIIVNYYRTGVLNVHSELVFEEEGLSSTDYTGHDEEILPRSNSPLLPLTSRKSMSGNSRLTLNETIRLSIEFCGLWFLANFATNFSLAYTSVASQTVLSSTSSFFTLFLGAFFYIERVTKTKLISSLLSFMGIILVTRSDYIKSHLHPIIKPSDSLLPAPPEVDFIHACLGNILALAGALLYSLYSILLKKKVNDESRINMKIFFGFVGLLTLILLWPVMFLLNYLQWEIFEIPSTRKVILVVVANCFITFISDYCWAQAMLLTSPFTVTVGLSITIPLAMLGDIIFFDKSMNLSYSIGAFLIMGSFFVINKASEEESIQQHPDI